MRLAAVRQQVPVTQTGSMRSDEGCLTTGASPKQLISIRGR